MLIFRMFVPQMQTQFGVYEQKARSLGKAPAPTTVLVAPQTVDTPYA